MCQYWPAIAKAIELCGALLVLVPLYKAVAVHFHHYATGSELRHLLDQIRAKSVAHGVDADQSVQRSIGMFLDRPAIASAGLGWCEMLLIMVGGTLIATGSLMEILERLHLLKWLC